MEFLYELVHAKTGRLTRQLFGDQRYDLALAKTGAALAEGDCEQAARTIEQVEGGAHVDAATVAAYRAAIAAGRRLDKDKRIDFHGAEGLESFLGARQSWQYVWATRVYDDVPSGFTIQVFTHDRPATVTLRGLRVERTD